MEVAMPGMWLCGSETEGAVARVDSVGITALLLEEGLGYFLNKATCWEGRQQTA